MILLKRIVEQQGTEGQYYDLGRDFSNFKRTIDGTSDQIKQKFEQSIGSKLVGKRIRARASRGYKQYVKDYEFDVMKITLDDYYDNYVVVAHDNTTPKSKEYFLKAGFKIQILGPSTGQPSPQKGGKEPIKSPIPISPEENPNAAQSQPMAQAPAGKTPSEIPVKEDEEHGYYEAYPIDKISQDIKSWLPGLLIKPETAMRDFVKSLGWMKSTGKNKYVAMFDIVIPKNALKSPLNEMDIQNIFTKISNYTTNERYYLMAMNSNESNVEWKIRIKKTNLTI